MASLCLPTQDKDRTVVDDEPIQPSAIILHVSDDRHALDGMMTALADARFIAVVSSFRVHLGDVAAAAAESRLLERLKELSARVVVFRIGHRLGKHSHTSIWLRRFGFAYPLVPRQMRSCFVTEAALSAAIDATRRAPTSRRLVTVLGPNRPWRDLFREHRSDGIVSLCLTCLCYLLSLLLVGQVAALILDLLARSWSSLKRFHFDTLQPKSFEELLALYNPHNFQNVKIVGYNNGVIHFGHRHPGKTVVSTVLCNRIVRTKADVIKADCGATIRKARDFLDAGGLELYVMPNYSYVCLGTAFFVPIHGSAADFTTVAEIITKALLYDPSNDRFLLATSDEPAFRNHVYNVASNMLVLRVWIRVKPKARYFVHQQDLENPSYKQLLDALRDPNAANVEIRKSKASSSKVRISKFYKAFPSGREGEIVEIPRDSLGRLWDRLEENPVTSFLMHALTRWLAWHVELFFTTEEFATFWNTHQALPLKKIQLRYIHRDGLPHSPFREHDCVSVDMFMFRWGRKAFEAYLGRTFAIVRSNPGKHSH